RRGQVRPAMGSLGRRLARSLLRGQPGLSLPPGPRCYGSGETRPRPDPRPLPSGPGGAMRQCQCGHWPGVPTVTPHCHQADQGLLDKHYQQLRQKPFYPALLAYMTSGPLVAMVWEGYNVVRSTRAMVGDTDSAVAAAGTIRGDFSMHVSRNVVHASDSVETAQREIGFWFQRNELVAWESGDRDYTWGP
ncbi:NDKM protein, partial [Columbina picui]|nr:NDKM protein [Columbina picui]